MAKADTEFARTAVALKLVTQEQARECLQLYAQQRKQGARVTLASVFVQKGYLTRAQVGAVVKASRQPRISHIGRYKLIAKVGQGGMGTVYKARQESLDKIVALKVLAPGLAKQNDFVERFIREAQASGQLNHPNIALGIDAGEADGYYYFAMEFVEGESLKAVLQREGKLDERRALEIALAMAKALGHAAEHSIVHRDVKPGNILLAADGTPKLVDLGLAKEVRADHSITQAGIPVGTPYYISPEQVRGEQQIDIRADIYALGGTLYHMVTGRVPFDGTTAAIVMTRHLNDPVPDPRDHTPELSDTVIAIINHCMAKNPDERYRTPAELCEDLEAALAGKPLPHARRIRPGPSRAAQRAAERKAHKAAQQRKLLIAGAIGAAAIALAVVLAVVLGRPKGSPATATGLTTQHHPQPRTSRPQPRTAHRPKPKTDAAILRAKKADAVLAELLALAEGDEDRERIEERFQDFILDYAGTKAVTTAKARLAGLKARWKAEEDFTAAIAEHLRERRFAAALAALDKPPFKEKTTKIEELIAALAQDVRTAAADYIEQQTARGEELIRQGDLAEAKQVFGDLARPRSPASRPSRPSNASARPSAPSPSSSSKPARPSGQETSARPKHSSTPPRPAPTSSSSATWNRPAATSPPSPSSSTPSRPSSASGHGKARGPASRASAARSTGSTTAWSTRRSAARASPSESSSRWTSRSWAARPAPRRSPSSSSIAATPPTPARSSPRRPATPRSTCFSSQIG